MSSLLNTSRPPVFCPGCTHEKIVIALDRALQQLEIAGDKVVVVSDIGCSGLFDVFFHTHALHGLHGRALTYAFGLKMARPELHVIVTMGDGGLGIGGAHVQSACRKNANLTLLVLNNFNFGMTGGQYSATTPSEAATSSGFLNSLESPLDICRLAEAAGAPFVLRCSGLEKDLAGNMARAIDYDGFAVMDIWGVCPGRYTRKNKLGPGEIRERIEALPGYTGVIKANERLEYGRNYRRTAAMLPEPPPVLAVDKKHNPPRRQKEQILILGSAGQRIVTAGELLCLAAMSGGLLATQKNDYDITVLKGPSVSEIIVWPNEIGYTGIDAADVVLVVSEEGVKRRRRAFAGMSDQALIIAAVDVALPESPAEVVEIDFKAWKIAGRDRALAALAVLAAGNRVLSTDMLKTAIAKRFPKGQAGPALELVSSVMDWLKKRRAQ